MSGPKHNSQEGGIGGIMVKYLSLLAVLVAFLLTSTVGLAADSVPNLVGTWAGKVTMHHKQAGFTENKVEYVIDEQRGSIFKGYKTLTLIHNKSKWKEGFAGVIKKDNKTFYIADHIDGIEFGEIDSPKELTIYHIDAGGEISKAGIVELKKQAK